ACLRRRHFAVRRQCTRACRSAKPAAGACRHRFWFRIRWFSMPQPRVLVVDDEPSMCALTSAMLERHGYAVMAFDRVTDALMRLECGETFDLAALDVVMPIMAGDDLARVLR